MKNLICIVLAAALLPGCAWNYQQPQSAAKPVVVQVAGTKDQIFQKVMAALLDEGYSIASSDRALGIISTQRRQMTLTPTDADVGSTWGIDYLKDKRTTTFVTVTIRVSDGQAVIRSNIEAEYLPENPTYGKRMTGVSKGTLEAKIAAHLRG